MEIVKQQIYTQARKQYTILISTILGQPFSQNSDAMVRIIKACTEYEVLEERNKSVWLAICKTCVPKQKKIAEMGRDNTKTTSYRGIQCSTKIALDGFNGSLLQRQEMNLDEVHG